MTHTTPAQTHAIRAQERGRARAHQLSLVERTRQGLALTGNRAGDPAARQLARMRQVAERRRRLDVAIDLDGRAAVLRIDDGRVPFAKATRLLGWDDDVELDSWLTDDRLLVAAAGPGQPARRGVASRLDSDHRYLMPAAIRTALGLAERDEVHAVFDVARGLAILESSRRLVARAYPHLYETVPTEPERGDTP